MIESQIIAKIKEVVEAIPQIREILMHPMGADIVEFTDGIPKVTGSRIKKYPAFVFRKDTFSNDFADSASNERVLNFQAWILVPAENVDNSEIFEKILPDVTDAVVGAFDKGWNFGMVENRRVWVRMASGRQGYTTESTGRVAWSELSLVVRLKVDVV